MKKLSKPVLAVVFLAGLSACTGDSCIGPKDRIPAPGSVPGQKGGACLGSRPWRTCDKYLHCTAGVCDPCGGPGEQVCKTTTDPADRCRPGLTEELGTNTCSGCGALGGACCRAAYPGLPYCQSGATCDTGAFKCIGATGGAGCESGTNAHQATCLDANGCAETATLMLATSSTSVADGCIKDHFKCASTNHDPVKHVTYCKEFMGMRSAGSLDATESTQMQCAKAEGGEGATVTLGACPPAP